MGLWTIPSAHEKGGRLPRHALLWGKHTLTLPSSNPAPRRLPKRNENLCPYDNLYVKVYSGFTHNYPRPEMSPMLLSWWQGNKAGHLRAKTTSHAARKGTDADSREDKRQAPRSAKEAGLSGCALHDPVYCGKGKALGTEWDQHGPGAGSRGGHLTINEWEGPTAMTEALCPDCSGGRLTTCVC